MRGPPRLYPPSTDDSLYVPSPSNYLEMRSTQLPGTPTPGAGQVRQYSLLASQKSADMWTQPGKPITPPPFRQHSDPDYGERLSGQFAPGWPMWGGTPTRLPPPARASAGTFDVAGSATTALRYLVVPPDRYSPVRGGFRGPQDVRQPNNRSAYSRAQAKAPQAQR